MVKKKSSKSEKKKIQIEYKEKLRGEYKDQLSILKIIGGCDDSEIQEFAEHIQTDVGFTKESRKIILGKIAQYIKNGEEDKVYDLRAKLYVRDYEPKFRDSD